LQPALRVDKIGLFFAPESALAPSRSIGAARLMRKPFGAKIRDSRATYPAHAPTPLWGEEDQRV
jgi:hypothetical protein